MKEIGDRVVIASVSGGKDSTAMCLHLQEQGIPYRAVFIDTGWENAATYRYVREDLPRIVGPVTWLRAEIAFAAGDPREEIAQRFEARLGHYSAMIRTILKKGMFASRVRRFCTQELKAFVIRDYLRGLSDEPINAIGIRAAESRARSNMPEWEHSESYDCDIWRPLIAWTEQDVIDIHTRHGVRPNPNYLQGASRVGCWPCIYARKSEIRHIASSDPERIAIIEDLETAVLTFAEQRYAKRGETLDSLGYTPPTWFVNPIPTKRADGTRDGSNWPIRRVVEWSRTKDRNGRQFELFAPAQRDQGCMRWGLCDVGKDETTE